MHFSCSEKCDEANMQKLARYIKILLNRSGIIGRILLHVIISVRFRKEIQSLRGTLPDNLNGRSLIHFSMNKSASQFSGKVLRSYADLCKMDFLSYNGFAFNSLVPVMEQVRMDEEKSRQLFKATGQVHSFYGRPVPDLINRSDLTILFLIRDPRDICVSHLKSLRKTHSEPSKVGSERNSFMNKRKVLNELSDEAAYQEIFEEIRSNPNEMLHFFRHFNGTKIVVKYEDLLDNPQHLYHILDDHFDKKITKAQMDRIGYVSARKNVQDSSHHRSGNHGQYKSVLSTGMVTLMNETWKDFLVEFGYNNT
jgi:hypothetical protein